MQAKVPKSPAPPYGSYSESSLLTQASWQQAKQTIKEATGCILGMATSCLASSTFQGWKPSLEGEEHRANSSLVKPWSGEDTRRGAGLAPAIPPGTHEDRVSGQRWTPSLHDQSRRVREKKTREHPRSPSSVRTAPDPVTSASLRSPLNTEKHVFTNDLSKRVLTEKQFFSILTQLLNTA